MKDNHEYVVLVDENDRQTGIIPKNKVHHDKTPLHRAFSLFLFNPSRQLLLQQRAGSKKTWPLVWSNSCCGHPMPGEPYKNAVKRRTLFELGIPLTRVIKVSDYRYCFSREGVMENEICPVFAAFHDGIAAPNPDEVEEIKWMDWDAWVEEITYRPDQYSPWCVEETLIMAQKPAWKSCIREMIRC